MANNFTHSVIPVSGEKIESLLATETSFLFLSKRFNDVASFQEDPMQIRNYFPYFRLYKNVVCAHCASFKK